jgi:Fur family transcriptional regulator, ferric uptake regulator
MSPGTQSPDNPVPATPASVTNTGNGAGQSEGRSWPTSRGAEAGAPELTIFEPLCAVFRKKLRTEGLKYTPERAQVLDSIIGFEGTFEADRVLEAVKRSGIRVSKATVYRTIRLLLDAGIIQRVLFDQEQTHYQLVYGQSAQDLLVRVDTGETMSIEIAEVAALRDALCRRLGLSPLGHRLHIFAEARQAQPPQA